MKIRMNISVSTGTKERLMQYAYEHHTTVSQAITDWVWKEKVKYSNLPGQMQVGEKK